MAIENIGLYPITIDVYKKHKESTVYANDNDMNGRGLLINLVKNNASFDSTGITLKIGFRNAVGEERLYDCDIVDVLTGQYKVFYPTEMLVGNGGRVVKLEIKAYESTGALLNYAPIFVYVNASEIPDDALAGTNEANSLVEALAQVQNIDENFSSVNAKLAHITQFIEDFEKYNTEIGYWDGAVIEALKNPVQLKFSARTYKFRNPIVFNGWNRAIEGSKNYMGGNTIFEFDGSGLFFTTGTRYTSVRNITLKGTDNIGVGIQFGIKGSPVAIDVHFVDIDNVLVTGFDVGIETCKNYDNTYTPTSIVWNSTFKNMRVEHCNVGYKANNSESLSFGLIFDKVYFNDNTTVLILSTTQANFDGCNFGIRHIDSFDIKDNSNIYFNNCNFECDSVVQGTGAIFNLRSQYISFENSMLLMRGLSTVNVFATYATLISLTFQNIRYVGTQGDEMINVWSNSQPEAAYIGSIQFLTGTKVLPKPTNWGAFYQSRYRDMDNDILTNWSNTNTGNYSPDKKGQMVYHLQKNIPVVHDGSNLTDFMGNALDGTYPIKISNKMYLDGGVIQVPAYTDLLTINYNHKRHGTVLLSSTSSAEKLKIERVMTGVYYPNDNYAIFKIFRWSDTEKTWIGNNVLPTEVSWIKISD